MPAPKADAEKALQGTLRKSRVKPPRSPEAIEKDMQHVVKAVEAMELNLKLASDAIDEHGVMVSTEVADSHGKVSKVERLNPAFKVQRDSLRMLLSLRKQAALLEAEISNATASDTQSQAHDDWSEFR